MKNKKVFAWFARPNWLGYVFFTAALIAHWPTTLIFSLVMAVIYLVLRFTIDEVKRKEEKCVSKEKPIPNLNSNYIHGRSESNRFWVMVFKIQYWLINSFFEGFIVMFLVFQGFGASVAAVGWPLTLSLPIGYFALRKKLSVTFGHEFQDLGHSI